MSAVAKRSFAKFAISYRIIFASIHGTMKKKIINKTKDARGKKLKAAKVHGLVNNKKESEEKNCTLRSGNKLTY